MQDWTDLQGNRICCVRGCTKKICARKMCPMHYHRWKLYGDPNIVTRSYSYGRNKTKHPLYSTWRGIIMRCHHPSCPAYPNYGGRGITVCDEWKGPEGFWNFVNDIGEKPGPEFSLDRIDNDKGYSLENCRWATREEQARNTRKNTYITIYNEDYCLAEACKLFGFRPSEILKLKTGYSTAGYERTLEEAFAQKIINVFKGGLAVCS